MLVFLLSWSIAIQNMLQSLFRLSENILKEKAIWKGQNLVTNSRNINLVVK